ncbi:MAG: histidinol-phosphate transaminase, partial [Steroidobacteraceae bacterium]
MSRTLDLARPDILSLQPYQHAAWEPSLERMHANEMPWRAVGDDSHAGLNRYPEPQPAELITHLAALYGVAPENVLAGRGSDEGIDLLVRAFCRAGQDSVLICPPTFGMYKVSARIQGAGVVEVPLVKERGFALDVAAVLAAWHSGVKLVFACTPNNPTGNLLEADAIQSLCSELAGRAVVVVDEAYIEFARTESLIRTLDRFENLVVLRTLSKAFALAGARCGALIAHADIVRLLARVITPYALPTHTIESVLKLTGRQHQAESQRRLELVRAERERLSDQLARLPLIRRVWPSDANFILVDCVDAGRVLRAAASVGLIIRDPRSQPGLAASVR